jgi:hypothetical protein
MENCGQGERRRGEISFLATLDIRLLHIIMIAKLYTKDEMFLTNWHLGKEPLPSISISVPSRVRAIEAISMVIIQFFGIPSSITSIISPPNQSPLLHPFRTHQVGVPRLLAIFPSTFLAFQLNFILFKRTFPNWTFDLLFGRGV